MEHRYEESRKNKVFILPSATFNQLVDTITQYSFVRGDLKLGSLVRLIRHSILWSSGSDGFFLFLCACVFLSLQNLYVA